MSDVIVRFFKGYTPNPTLRDLVGQEAELPSPRTNPEEAAKACMPGDRVEDHPLYSPPNPFLTHPYSQLKDMLRQGLSDKDERLVRSALHMQELQHTDGIAKAR